MLRGLMWPRADAEANQKKAIIPDKETSEEDEESMVRSARRLKAAMAEKQSGAFLFTLWNVPVHPLVWTMLQGTAVCNCVVPGSSQDFDAFMYTDHVRACIQLALPVCFTGRDHVVLRVRQKWHLLRS